MLAPERLARHPDAVTRESDSQWTEDIAEYATEKVLDAMRNKGV